MKLPAHQYIDRHTGAVKTERLFADRIVHFLYNAAREFSPWAFKSLTSRRASELLGYLNYDCRLSTKMTGLTRFVNNLGIDLTECTDPPSSYASPREIFERKVRYWEFRPMDDDPDSIVSPADARLLFGSFRETSQLFLKEKFFDFEELLGSHKSRWLKEFDSGDYAILRLTPDKYHYNHTPVSGQVCDFYELKGDYHSCNPSAVISVATPYSKNKRIVTIIDTNVPEGSQVGYVAMIEIVALMIGDIQQCYSESYYDNPQPITKGMFLRKGQPKSLYRPGSSTDAVLFQKGHIHPCQDLLENMYRHNVVSRYALGFGRSIVETDVQVRSTIARSAQPSCTSHAYPLSLHQRRMHGQ